MNQRIAIKLNVFQHKGLTYTEEELILSVSNIISIESDERDGYYDDNSKWIKVPNKVKFTKIKVVGGMVDTHWVNQSVEEIWEQINNVIVN